MASTFSWGEGYWVNCCLAGSARPQSRGAVSVPNCITRWGALR